jgi:radical SAM protein with 4Fe4S-binding SPASM domain
LNGTVSVRVPGPRYAILELGLRCNLKCLHCASGAGQPRPDELDLAAWLGVVDDLALLGCRAVDLMGGEPLLSPLLEPVGDALKHKGIPWGLLTNGWLLDRARGEGLLAHGCRGMGVSLDGAAAATHDAIRGREGSWQRALGALDTVAALRGLDGNRTVLTSINRANLRELSAMADLVEARFPGFRWQLNLTAAEAKRMPSGMRLLPDEIEQVAEFIHDRRQRGGRVKVSGSHDLGYFLDDRDLNDDTFRGCPAGVTNLGVQSDGKVKGCLALDERFIVGDVRERPLREIWRDERCMAPYRAFSVAALGPNCADCVWGSRCKGGCLAYSTAATGIARNHPHCLWRRASSERRAAAVQGTSFSSWPLHSVCMELTLRCNLRCLHCGSAAGDARKNELTLPELIPVLEDLRMLGAERLVLLGGEPLLHPDWEEIVTMAKAFGLRVSLISNGLAVTQTVVAALAGLGVDVVGISVDGASDEVHDRLRGAAGARTRAWAAVDRLRSAGLPVTVITTVMRANLAELPLMRDQLAGRGGLVWQIQSANGTGERFPRDLLPSPADLLWVARFVEETRRLFPADRLAVATGHNIGHHACGVSDHAAAGAWRGCPGGITSLGIGSDGSVKPCLSMGDREIVGNVRSVRLRELWRDPALFAHSRRFAPGRLMGGCAACPHGSECRAGCPEMARTATGDVWDNPFCLRQAEKAVS